LVRALPYSTSFAVLAQQLKNHDDTPTEDKIVVVRGLAWDDYQRMLEVRGEASAPRFAFLGGELEIMTPSRPHESIKSRISLLVAVWCETKAIDFSAYGSWTLENRSAELGLEPDECYVFGAVAEPERPDLAIEVVWTRGGLKKLEIYAELGVPEVWFWRRGRITVHVLEEGRYVDSAGSHALPGIDLDQLAGFLDRPTDSQAMREYRAALSVAP
jgi:Uma2 family endonuclease